MVALRVAIQIYTRVACKFPSEKRGGPGWDYETYQLRTIGNEGATIKEQTEQTPTISTSKTVGMPTLLFLISVQTMHWD